MYPHPIGPTLHPTSQADLTRWLRQATGIATLEARNFGGPTGWWFYTPDRRWEWMLVDADLSDLTYPQWLEEFRWVTGST
jgi:hypothetical protein